MKQTAHKPLTVYKASAGSGKTFTLATEYMKLVVANPQAYRTILAVTFTNKATEEMKLRIISQLYGISRLLPESESYLRMIQDSLELSREQVAARAKEALHNLLHHYSYFRVETIDSFFQRVMSNLAKELELTANLRVELNDIEIEEKAVDELIESLSVDNRLLHWILDYIRSNITEDKNWNVIRDIKKFGHNIFKDFYKNHEKVLTEKLSEKGFFDHYVKTMYDIKHDVDDMVQQFAATFFDALDENNLTENDFAYKKSGVWGYFHKMMTKACLKNYSVNSYVSSAHDDINKWFTKANAKPSNPAYAVVQDLLKPLLDEAINRMPMLLRRYKSAEVTLSNLSQLRLLSSIDQKIRDINLDANRFLLSDTQSLLHSLIQTGEGDSSFIFEKIGAQLEHIMIDEFQDTSTTQWKNFKVLLDETMSHEDTNNLIVGDVKQSIYRWRAGDWRLLNDIEREFPNPSQQLRVQSLARNYRSQRRVIQFNNQFFTHAVECLCGNCNELYPAGADMLRQAYADVVQDVPEGKPDAGYVCVRLLPNEEYRDTMMQTMVDTVDCLIAQGAKEGDIAILVRSNDTIRNIADYFLANRPQYKLVSDEAFRLDASTAVNVLVMALRLLYMHDDITEATLKHYYHHIITHDESAEDDLPADFTEHKAQLLSLPLIDLVERLASIFRIHALTDQSAYVCAFYDHLNKYLQDGTGSIEDFLDEWDNGIHKKTIQSDGVSGIRLMTIHKSKGLEYEHIIMPFCDWANTKSHVIWCEPKESPYDEMPLIPVDCNKKNLAGTFYEDDYLYESLQETVDNLNLLYVAFTRARQNLFVYGKRDATLTRSKLIEDCIGQVAESLADSTVQGLDEDKTHPILFEYGEMKVEKEMETKGESDNVFLQPSTRLTVDAGSYPLKVEFKQSNKSRQFVEGDDEESTRNDYMRLGILLHQVLSAIETADDVDSALAQLHLDGVLSHQSMQEEKLRDMLYKRLQSEQIKSWFSNKWRVFSECAILTVNPQDNEVQTYRPDRVMTDGNEVIVVDFKFATPRPEHQQQVQGYMDLLRQMGHAQVSGYLWYVYPNQIVKV